MYTEFYNLREKPFNLNPSPRFLYLGESHREALNLLKYGVMERKGFILLTGEIGTGKTTMIQALLSSVDDSVHHIHLSNPILSPRDFMDFLAFSAFSKKIHFRSKAEFLLEFEEFLRQCLSQQRNVILIIDEAQKLSLELLEEIRLLSNMETGDEKLINIFLVGQPELNRKLSHQECLPLLQRISIRYHIPPLDLEDTRGYVATRLRVAGALKGDQIFSKSAVEALYEYSGGYPRVINVLADNSLLLGYSKGAKTVTPGMVRRCHDDMRLDGVPSEDRQKVLEHPKTSLLKSDHIGHYWKWAAVLFLLLAILAFGLTQTGRGLLSRLFDFGQAAHQPSSDDRKAEQPFLEEDEDEKEATHIALAKPTELIEESSFPKEELTEPQKTIVVQSGDTLSQLAIGVYGRDDEAVLRHLQRHNPNLSDINMINVGQELRFPPLLPIDRGLTYTVHIATFQSAESAQGLFKKLVDDGYEVYILPVYYGQKGKLFRVTLGNYAIRRDAEDYASLILKEGISRYAEILGLEARQQRELGN
jgi:type II secretory pathway predicted ATPase ExeA/LysM repeat protein